MAELIVYRINENTEPGTIKQKYPKHKHYSPDMYFTDDQGNLNLDLELMSEAKDWCQSMAEKAMRKHHNVLIMDVQFTADQVDIYRNLAHKYRYSFGEKAVTSSTNQ
jgi:hypothetical protein